MVNGVKEQTWKSAERFQLLPVDPLCASIPSLANPGPFFHLNNTVQFEVGMASFGCGCVLNLMSAVATQEYHNNPAVLSKHRSYLPVFERQVNTHSLTWMNKNSPCASEQTVPKILYLQQYLVTLLCDGNSQVRAPSVFLDSLDC